MVVMKWISGFLRAFRRVCRDGDEADFWVFAGVPAGVPPVVLRRSLYVIYSMCLSPYNVVRRGTSCHCERRKFGAMRVPPVLSFCQRLYSVGTPCTRRGNAAVCASEWSRGPFRSLRVLHDGRGGRVHAPHAPHATIFFS
jgi:hypothetical protein